VLTPLPPLPLAALIHCQSRVRCNFFFFYCYFKNILLLFLAPRPPHELKSLPMLHSVVYIYLFALHDIQLLLTDWLIVLMTINFAHDINILLIIIILIYYIAACLCQLVIKKSSAHLSNQNRKY